MIYSRPSGITWDNDPENPMRIVIKSNGVTVMHFFLGEAMEGAGRKNVMAHVEECDRSDWTQWYQEAKQETFDILNQK